MIPRYYKIFFIFLILSIVFYSCKDSLRLTNEGSDLNSFIINSEKLHYTKKGNGETIIFVHGTISDYRTWNKQIDTFATEYQAIAYSRRYAFPNKQLFDQSLDYSPIIHSEDLLVLIDSLKLEKVHLVGHSYGAYTALLAAIKNPDKIKSLVLGEPPILPMLANHPMGDSLYNETKQKAFEPAKKAFEIGDESRAVAVFIGGVMGDSTLFYKAPPEARMSWLSNTVELRGNVINQKLPSIDTLSLKELNIPILLIKGELSPIKFPIIIEQLHKHLPNSKVVTLTNSSHGLQGQNPKEFNREVFAFIKNN